MKVDAVLWKYYKDKNGKCAVKIRISDKGRERYVNTDFKVRPGEWTGKFMYWVRGEDRINDVLLQLIKQYDRGIQEVVNVHTFIDQVVDMKMRSGSISSSRVHKYRQLSHELLSYSKRPVQFADIDYTFFEGFKAFLSVGRKPNTVQGYLKVLKTVMREGFDHGVSQNRFFESSKYKVPSERTSSVYLSIDELARIEDLKLTGTANDVRNAFLFACDTGLRWSDLKKANMANVKDGLLYNRNQKTGVDVVVPLSSRAMRLISRGIRVISSQKANDHLKQICLAAKLGKVVFKGELVDKWRLISTHTGRRSFATNAYLSGLDRISIMKITGHRTEASFMKYIRIEEEENASLLKLHKFFE